MLHRAGDELESNPGKKEVSWSPVQYSLGVCHLPEWGSCHGGNVKLLILKYYQIFVYYDRFSRVRH